VTLSRCRKTFDPEAISPVNRRPDSAYSAKNRGAGGQGEMAGFVAAHPGIGLHLIGPLHPTKARERWHVRCRPSVDRPLLRSVSKEINPSKDGRNCSFSSTPGGRAEKAGVAPGEPMIYCRLREKYGLRSPDDSASRRSTTPRRRISR